MANGSFANRHFGCSVGRWEVMYEEEAKLLLTFVIE
jgi:hypothetical protein